MFLQLPDMEEYIPFIIAAALLGFGVILLSLGLAITRAQERKSIKWVAVSFFIQFGVAIFFSAPLALEKILAIVYKTKYEGPQTPAAVAVIAVSVFILVNFINMIHKPGIINSIVIILFIVGPIGGSIYLIFSGI